MAFHVACPITCRRICFCSLGFPRTLLGDASSNGFLDQVFKIQNFINDPWRDGQKTAAGGVSTVQVAVPRVEPLPPPPPPALLVVDGADADEAAAVVSAQTKRVALQRKAAAAMVAAEDYARRFESGDLADAPKDPLGEEQVLSNVNVMCRLCFTGENEGSKRARGMLSCRSCDKKYHRSCLKTWAQHRDLFHWSSWTCPSCRTCEVCRRTGDPNKFMFCRRCDGAYHCYCQQPPHKNVSSGPYVCPKHTRCHSCGSNVPGNGLSVRWFLGYTCCDACGRLFVKGNYCPVCLKVYRDSESTPMVCCDVCQRWVHCQCDGISDEKYLQFQVDGNLQYKCATCRGECYQIKDLQDAVQELWRRKDIADQDLIANLRAAAGLPTQEETLSISPYSDDEDNAPTTSKNEFGRTLKFSLKGLVDKSPKKTKEYGKKSSYKKTKKKGYQTPSIRKKEPHQVLEGPNDVHSSGKSFDGDMNGDMQSLEIEEHDIVSSPVARSPNQTGLHFVNQPEVVKHKFINEVMVSDEDRKSKPVPIKGNKPHGLDSGEDAGKFASKSKTVKANKLVINLGSRKINLTKSPSSDTSSFLRERDLMASNGREDSHQHRKRDKLMADGHDSITNCADGNGDSVDYSSQLKGSNLSGRDETIIKLGRAKPEVSIAGEYDTTLSDYSLSIMGKRNSGRSVDVSGPKGEAPTLRKQLEGKPDMQSKIDDDCFRTTVSNSVPKESKLSLKFKIRNPQLENGNSSVQHGEEERSFIKGQRSKRKRPSPIMERTLFDDQNVLQSHDNLPVDARILKRLGTESIGKVVEVHHSADDSWHRGVVSDVILGTSKLSVTLDNGRVRTLELENQGVRFAPQKQRRSKTRS